MALIGEEKVPAVIIAIEATRRRDAAARQNRAAGNFIEEDDNTISSACRHISVTLHHLQFRVRYLLILSHLYQMAIIVPMSAGAMLARALSAGI